MENKNTNYNYIFWNNTYEGIWYAIPRDKYMLFFNGNRSKITGVLKDKDFNKLIKKTENEN